MDRGTVNSRGRLRRVQPQPTFGTAAFVIPKGVLTGALVIGAAGLLIAIGISVYLVFLRRTRAVAGAKGRRRIPSGSGQADAEVVVEDRRWARGGRRGAGGGLLATLPSVDYTPFRGLGDNSPRGGGGSFFSGLMGRLLSNLRATSRRDPDDYDDGWDGASTGRSTGPRFMASTVSGKPLQVVVKTAAVAARHPDASSLSLPLTSGAAAASSLPLSQQQQQQQRQQQRQASYAFGGPGGGGGGGGGGNVSGGGGLDPTGQSAERYLHTLWESMHSTGPVVGSSSSGASGGANGGVNGGGGGSGAKSRGGAAGAAGGQHGRGVSPAAGAAVAAPARLDVHDGEGAGAAGPGPGPAGLPPGLPPLRVGGGGGAGPRSGASTSGPSSSSARGGMGTAATAVASAAGEAGGGGGTPLARISLGAGAAFPDSIGQPGSAKSGGGGDAAPGGGGGGGSAGAAGTVVGISLGGAGDSIPGLSSSYAEAAMVALMAAGGAISNTPQRGGGGGGGGPGGGGSVDPAVAWYGKKMAGAQQAAGSTSVTATSVAAAAAVGAVGAADAGPGAKAHLA
ncbi:hypothetical protein HYH02_008964 [Chlamydomonas schloesseri]|uniref:Uncharacterized protein n=1 Tax=Chlamydomonas schloesseri TaxID=2026947 RepID=A0A835WCX8_9CHLO|nr:hypothetical protein HYH02_008964 [Chlamydomonas schloesseri]|eukprot:KAG2445097.1 hypothetical protein HYH02_008964 [Chlamydomonas schloesseri]